MALKREIRLYIESELRDYDNTKKEWEIIQNNAIYGSGSSAEDCEVRGTDVGQPTERKAFKLLTNRRLAQLERTMKAIEKVSMNLTEESFKLVQMRYWDKPKTLTDEGIAMELCIDRATLYRLVNTVLLALAKEMGLVD